MNIRNCRKCGKLFNYISGQPICPACREEMEEKFQEVKQYVQNNRDTSIPAVAEACDIEESQIRQWVREERLVFAEGSAFGIECESCGAMIKTGRFCDKCKAEMVNSLSGAIKKPEMAKPQMKRDTRENPKMRFLDNH
ncbi:MAG TPA: flagellar protein [Lachnospiraceae bacterium]|nr:flagellar protein [Lachnospiraceae bacterium]